MPDLRVTLTPPSTSPQGSELRTESKATRGSGPTRQKGATSLEIVLPCDPAIPLPGIDPKDMNTANQRDACLTMFTAAQFTTAKNLESNYHQMNRKENVACTQQNSTQLSRKTKFYHYIKIGAIGGHCVNETKLNTEKLTPCALPHMWERVLNFLFSFYFPRTHHIRFN